MELFCLPTLSLCKALRTLFCWFHNDVISVLAPLTQPIFQRFHSELLNFNNFYQMILSPLVFFLFSERKAMEMVRKCKRQVFPFALLDSNLFKHGILLDDLDFSISFTMCTVYIVYKQRKVCTTFFFEKDQQHQFLQRREKCD